MTDLATNVLGGILESCSTSPMTGFLRTGCCQVTDEDVGNHGVCAVMTDDFLHYSKRAGNDLSTPRPEYGFPGLRAGDRWCLVVLAATSSAALEFCRLTDLTKFAVDAPPNPHTRKE